MRPLVTVGIPVYNCDKYISAAIDSVLNQTYRDYELLIINDGSTDKSLDIILRYESPRIRVINHARNQGQAATWTEILREASGKYIKLLCADDIIYSDCLETQVNILEANKSVVMTACGRDMIDENGKKIWHRGFPGKPGVYDGASTVGKTVRWGTNIFGEPNAVLFRKQYTDLIRGFSFEWPYMIDVELYCRLLMLGNVFISKETMCAFRISQGSLSTSLAKYQSEQFRGWAYDLHKQGYVSMTSYIIGSTLASLYGIARRRFYAKQTKAD